MYSVAVWEGPLRGCSLARGRHWTREASLALGTLESLAAGVLLTGFDGVRVPRWLGQLVDRGLAGVVLFSRNVESRGQLGLLTRELRAGSEGLVVATDEEGGGVTRIDWLTGSPYPGNAALGHVDDLALTRRVGHAVAANLADVGVTFNLAPCADILTWPVNVALGVRSFGSTARVVSRHTAAFLEGHASGGVSACAKHFPGHGQTAVDSHVHLPVSQASPAAVREHLLPFRAAISVGCAAVMTGHVIVPSFDPWLPATLSRRTVEGLLRDELGFRGAVVTDALEMGALSHRHSVGDASVLALRAGCDGLVLGTGPEPYRSVAAAITAIAAAVRNGQLGEERLLQARHRLRPLSCVGNAALDRDAGAAAALRSVGHTLPGPLARPVTVIECVDEAAGAVDRASPLLSHWLAKFVDPVRVCFLHEGSAPGQVAAFLDGRAAGSMVVVADSTTQPWTELVLRTILVAEPNAVHVETGLRRVPSLAPLTINTWGPSAVALQRAARILAGVGASW